MNFSWRWVQWDAENWTGSCVPKENWRGVRRSGVVLFDHGFVDYGLHKCTKPIFTTNPLCMKMWVRPCSLAFEFDHPFSCYSSLYYPCLKINKFKKFTLSSKTKPNGDVRYWWQFVLNASCASCSCHVSSHWW